MPFRASDFRGLDYGNAVRQGQDIAYNRLRNTALGQEQERRDELIRKRAEADRVRQTMETLPDAIAELDSLGNFEEADRLRDSYLRQMKGGVEVARMLSEGLNETNYEQVRHDMIQSGAITGDMWPTEYSSDWWAKKVAKQKSDLDQLTVQWRDENGFTVSQDLLARDGDIFWRGSPFEAAADRQAREGGDGDGAGFEFKASDSNAIGNQVTRLFGGTYNPETGRFAGLNPQQAQQAQAVHAAADELYMAAGGRIPHAAAVREAAKRLRINIENPDDTLATDPAGILPQGGQYTPPLAGGQ